MLHPKFFNPSSIVVVGGSNDVKKPGGKLVSNLIAGKYAGVLYIVNPKYDVVQGVQSYANVQQLPDVDLAVLAIPAKDCPATLEFLASQRNTKAFIIISAGFSEESQQGAQYEKAIKETVDKYGASLIGPNCIGVITTQYSAVFTSPVPQLEPDGCDLISSSGATAMFIIESAMSKGLTFSGVYSVGNSTQIGVEEMMEHFDLTFDSEKSSKVKLLYLESVKNPDKLLFHARSLIKKGCKIAAIKAGSSVAGSRAAMSHTGAMATSDLAVEALFRKAGIVRCFGREELTTVASVFMHKTVKGKRIAIITHAGGPAVMLTDALSVGGLEIPQFDEAKSNELLQHLPHGASAKNPIDILATGTPQQLEIAIDYCEKYFDNIDAIMVIFGSTGLTRVYEAYDVLHRKMQTCCKPIFPILPSVHSAYKELDCFLSRGHINFPDEVQLGHAIAKIFNTAVPAYDAEPEKHVDKAKLRNIIDTAPNGFVSNATIEKILQSANINMVETLEVNNNDALFDGARKIGFPLVVKACGPLHKSDVGGVTLNIKSEAHLLAEFNRMMKIKDTYAVSLQPMLSGLELFVGAHYEPKFGHIVMCGLGGIFVEILEDVSSGLAPLSYEEAISMVHSLKSYKIIKGARGSKPVSEHAFAQIIVNLSSLLRFAAEIKEIDLNPVIATPYSLTVVDARLRIEK
ncbi:MAG TPA: acetate--CoA ligase family protein [Bacteroidales bacterium]|nr:acetate--CoA ligase family protein [Bacteroidales bacterium]